MDKRKKKHKRMDRYWRIYHLAHTREAAAFQKNLLHTIRRIGSPQAYSQIIEEVSFQSTVERN